MPPNAAARVRGIADGYQVFMAEFAAGIAPAPRQEVSSWADRNRFVAQETSAHPGPWRTNTMPPLREIMDCLSEHHPAETVTVAKSAQIGGSEVAMNWLGYIVGRGLGATMVIHPTLEGAGSWQVEKMNPTINETPALRKLVRDQRSRSGDGSTAKRKKFPGGFILLAGANSSATLRQHSIRNIVKDDWDGWAFDVDGQGDPDKMADARQMAYHAAGLSKTLQISTPTMDGASRIWDAFEAGDQRRYHVPCPHCGELQTLTFDRLRFDRTVPHRAWYACAANGCVIEHHHKQAMIRDAAAGGEARWIAGKPGEGRQPSFHLNALYSPFTTWDKMAAAFLAAKDKPQELKTFVNLWLGETWKDKGSAPAWERLRDRSEPYQRNQVPRGGVILTAAVDVQKSHLVYEVVAWGAGLASWVVDASTIPGVDCENAHDPAWTRLRDHVRRKYRFAGGRAYRVEVTAIDSGFATQAVYAFVRRNANTIAIKGAMDWRTPPITRPSPRDVKASGKVIRRGLHVWKVGTFQIKSAMYARLRIGMPDPDVEVATPLPGEALPHGFQHFGDWLPDAYFQELTSEILKTSVDKKSGRTVREWAAVGPNHWHDCRVYNEFAAEYLHLTNWTDAKWKQEGDKRTAPGEASGDLFDQVLNAGLDATEMSHDDAGGSAESTTGPVEGAEPAGIGTGGEPSPDPVAVVPGESVHAPVQALAPAQTERPQSPPAARAKARPRGRNGLLERLRV